MIKPAHSPVFQYFFDLWLSYAFKKNFSRMKIIGEINDKQLPLLIIANHVSWWDGFWILRLNKMLFQRKFHVMMLEDQLQSHGFLRKLGAFSIRKRSKTLRMSLEFASSVLNDPGNLLLFFPQGKISSQYDIPVKFEKGLGTILRLTDNPIQIVMVAHLTDYFSHQRPILNQYVFSPELVNSLEVDELENIYNDFFNDCIKKQKLLE
jgi:1-acyl-sn-glycerol-3-phosphate acyltransferase